MHEFLYFQAMDLLLVYVRVMCQNAWIQLVDMDLFSLDTTGQIDSGSVLSHSFSSTSGFSFGYV